MLKINHLFIVPLAVATLLTGCSNSLTASSEEIISHVMQSEDQTTSYQGKGEMKVYLNDELTEHSTFEEYVEFGGQRKIVMTDHMNDDQVHYSVRESDRVLLYEEGADTAQSIDLAGMEEVGNQTQKEMLTGILERIKDTHSYEVAGEEDILGGKAYHLKVTADKNDSLFGDMEFWVDQETWFIVKAISSTGDFRSETTYSELTFNPDFSDDVFSLDLPEGVEIVALEDQFPTYSGTVQEAAEALGQPFLIFDAAQAEQEAEWYVFEGELSRTEINIPYLEDGVPMMTLTVFETPEGAELNGNMTVRGVDAQYMEMIRHISWDENGLRYGILIDHPDLTPEDAIEKAEHMIMTDALAATE
ncbi:LolA family protein [Paenibacillus daejeonensis]|uniref:LolA family protein n=1 Tax=Paenibacillus daejeonensis TaxID=135193 RepID=UPI0003751F8B|nr:DUF2092 domain-containing protein [Paenibacillus daejeonensis]